MYYSNSFAQQGWQCPICGRVYSPHTTMCLFCVGHQGFGAIDVTCLGYTPIEALACGTAACDCKTACTCGFTDDEEEMM